MAIYKITYLAGKMETSICPPVVVKAVFSSYNGEPVTLNETECTVTFEEEQIPVDLGPLVKVEQI